MIKLLQRLFWRCRHRWEVMDKYDIIGEPAGIPIGSLFVLRCSRCGELKTFKAADR